MERKILFCLNTSGWRLLILIYKHIRIIWVVELFLTLCIWFDSSVGRAQATFGHQEVWWCEGRVCPAARGSRDPFTGRRPARSRPSGWGHPTGWPFRVGLSLGSAAQRPPHPSPPRDRGLRGSSLWWQSAEVSQWFLDRWPPPGHFWHLFLIQFFMLCSITPWSWFCCPIAF